VTELESLRSQLDDADAENGRLAGELKELRQDVVKLIDILATSEGMADCADSPLMKLREKIEKGI